MRGGGGETLQLRDSEDKRSLKMEKRAGLDCLRETKAWLLRVVSEESRSKLSCSDGTVVGRKLNSD